MKKYKNFTTFLTLVLFALSVTLTACSASSSELQTSSQTDSSSESEMTTIKLAVYPLMSPYFQYAIDELGLYEEQNIEVELVEFAQYADVITALQSGNVDASIVGITEVVAPILGGLDLEIVAMTDYSAGMDGIVANTGIGSIADLNGKTVATNIGSMNHMILLSAMKKEGLSETDVNIINMSEGDATASLVGGSIDAASIFEPQMSKAASESGGAIIFDSADVPGELSDILMVKKSLSEDNPQAVQGLVNAWYAVQEKYEENPSEVLSIISEKSGISTEELEGFMSGLDMTDVEYNKDLFANNNEKMNELITGAAEFLVSQDLVEEVPTKEQIDMAINSSYIEALE